LAGERKGRGGKFPEKDLAVPGKGGLPNHRETCGKKKKRINPTARGDTLMFLKDLLVHGKGGGGEVGCRFEGKKIPDRKIYISRTPTPVNQGKRGKKKDTVQGLEKVVILKKKNKFAGGGTLHCPNQNGRKSNAPGEKPPSPKKRKRNGAWAWLERVVLGPLLRPGKKRGARGTPGGNKSAAQTKRMRRKGVP